MRELSSNPVKHLVLASCVLLTAACSPPLTDITSTVSEDVGPWDVANAKVNGEVLTTDVCMNEVGSADAISERLLLQLINKGYRRIELTMYAAERSGSAEQRHVSWTPERGREMQPAMQAAQNPCARPAEHPAE